MAFLQAVVDTQPRRREIHVIVDDLSAHKTQKIRTFLAAHPTVRLHKTAPLVTSTRRQKGWLAAVGKSVVVTDIAGCRPRVRLPIDMGEV